MRVRLSIVASVFALLIGQTPAWASGSLITVETGKVRTQRSTVVDASGTQTAGLFHSKRKSGRTHGANSTWCGEADCGGPSETGSGSSTHLQNTTPTNPGSTPKTDSHTPQGKTAPTAPPH